MTEDSRLPTKTTEVNRYTRGRLSRGKGLRNTTGCVTCRKRHVKCDEVKPRCGGCARKKARCEYGTPQPGSVRRCTRRRPGPDGIDEALDQAEERESDHDHTGQVTPEGHEPSVDPQERARVPETPHTRDDVLPGELNTSQAGDPETSIQSDSFQPTELDASTSLTAVFEESPRAHLGAQGHENNGSSQSLPRPIVYGLPSPGQTLFQSAINQCASTPDSAITYGVPLTTRWLDLLIGDASLHYGPLREAHLPPGGLNIFGNSVAHSPVSIDEDSVSHEGSTAGGVVETRHPYLRERIVGVRDRLREKDQAWKALEPLSLQAQEHILFRHFTDHVSQWLDLFEPKRPFGTLVPHLALRSVGLMNAILALSARHLDIVNRETPTYTGGYRPIPNDIVGYYYKTLHYCQEAMQYDTYQTSLELLASAIIISSYEMLDGSSTDWEKHLKGVFWIQRSQTIHGHSGGLRQAVWWAWLCQDVWAAFREKRKPFTFWRPNRLLADLDPTELAARSAYNFAQVVGFCAEDRASEESSTSDVVVTKMHKADLLFQQLEQWRSYLTFEFNPIPILTPGPESDHFPTVWIQPAAFAVSMQLYYCSMILLHLHRPCYGGYGEYLDRQRSLERWANTVCGIAKSSKDTASTIMSSQCVFIAGLVTQDRSQRTAILGLLDDSRQRSGWPSYSLGHELQKIWGDL